MGVKFVTVADADAVVGIARNTEREVDDELLVDTDETADTPVDTAADGEGTPAGGTTPESDATPDAAPEPADETHDSAPQEDGTE